MQVSLPHRLINGIAYNAVVVVGISFAVYLYVSATAVTKNSAIIDEVLNGAYSMVIVCDHKGSVVYANQNLEKYTGFTIKELKAGGMSLIIEPTLESRHAIAFSKMMEKPTYTQNSFHRRVSVCTKAGGRIEGGLTVRLVHGADGPTAYAYFLPDSVMAEVAAYPSFAPTPVPTATAH